jgi:hypothetical protein
MEAETEARQKSYMKNQQRDIRPNLVVHILNVANRLRSIHYIFMSTFLSSRAHSILTLLIARPGYSRGWSE